MVEESLHYERSAQSIFDYEKECSQNSKDVERFSSEKESQQSVYSSCDHTDVVEKITNLQEAQGCNCNSEKV